jgi:type I restriction enzyme M protein
VKYRALLSGLEATEVKLSDLNLGDRLDAEYVSKENLLISRRLRGKPTCKLGDLGRLAVSAFYPAATHLYAEGDVPFVRCVDCISYPVISTLQDDSFERIPSSFLAEHNTIDTVGKGDLIITKVGSPCYASIIHEYEELALSRTVMGLKDIVDINPYYLLAFLRSHYGFSQLLRQRELTIQYQLTVERVKDVDVFTPTSDFQTRIESIVKAGHHELVESKALYAEAELLLLDELGLKEWQPFNELSYECTASEVFASGRLDSEFFHPRYLRLANLLGAHFQLENIGTWAKVLKGLSLEYTDSNKGVPVIRSGDLLDLENEEKFLRASPEQEMFLLKRGDVLISSIGFGSIGKIQVFDKNGDFATVSEVTVIRQHRVNPYYLHFYLRCSAGQMQINRYITGATGQLHLYPRDVGDILVPIPPRRLEAKLERLFMKSRAVKMHSRSMLNLAKRGVEIAIEQDEAAAFDWLRHSKM